MTSQAELSIQGQKGNHVLWWESKDDFGVISASQGMHTLPKVQDASTYTRGNV